MNNSWVQIILLLAPVLLVLPAAKTSLKISLPIIAVGLLAAALLTLAYLLNPGKLGGTLSVGWLLYTLYLLRVAHRLRLDRKQPIFLSQLCQLAAFIYLCIGAAWAVADRLGWQPLGFDPLIVLLTAVHFHYAGFALPWISSKLLPHMQAEWEKHLVASVVLGVPLTAIGITSSQFNGSPLIEVVFVGIMAIGGIMVGYQHLKLASKSQHSTGLRILWGIAGLSLTAGMGLALLYGLRFYFLLPWLSIPWMYAVHGSINSLGFALPAVIAWYWYGRESSSDYRVASASLP